MAVDDLRIQEWQSWLLTIGDEVLSLSESRRMFAEVTRLFQYNDAELARGPLWGWMAENWAWSVAMGVGGLTDMRPGVISMGRLLEEIENHSEILTREWFTPRLAHAPDARMANTADAVFNQYAPEGAPHVLAEKVRRDREYLQDTADRVRTVVSQRFAHLPVELAPEDVPLEEVGNTVTRIGARYRVYELLLNQRWAVEMEPSLPKDWDRPFVTPLNRPS